MRPRLVVIGNGMAGARTVEEILARGGDFDITMFGDEPYGNYNRIMLSNLLAGVEDEAGIYLNDLGWYADNGITLNAGVRIERIDRFAKKVYATDGTATRRRPKAGRELRVFASVVAILENLHDRHIVESKDC